MFKIFARIFRRRFWKNITFAELAELYVSRMLRIFAMHMITVFIAVYLYLEGYGVAAIGLYFAGYFGLRMLLVPLAARLVAHIGPKHSTLWGNLFAIPSLLLLAFVSEYGPTVLIPAIIFKACSTALYDLAYMVNFSTVRHVDHVGKELGVMYILERLTHGLSPLIGGFVAFWFGPQAAIWLAAVVFTLAAAPLLLTAEPTKTHQQVTFKGIPWRKIWRNLTANTAIIVSTEFSAGTPWNLFLLVCVITAASGNEAFAVLGVLSALAMVVSMTAPYVFGRLVDKDKGGLLLKVAAGAQSLVHLFRPFIQTPVGAAAANITSESATIGANMPFMRGMFDTADTVEDGRITYMALMGMALAFGGVVANLLMVGFVLVLGEQDGLRWMFVAAAVVALLISQHGFRLYHQK